MRSSLRRLSRIGIVRFSFALVFGYKTGQSKVSVWFFVYIVVYFHQQQHFFKKFPPLIFHLVDCFNRIGCIEKKDQHYTAQFDRYVSMVWIKIWSRNKLNPFSCLKRSKKNCGKNEASIIYIWDQNARENKNERERKKGGKIKKAHILCDMHLHRNCVDFKWI